jgi:hypothetical protein
MNMGEAASARLSRIFAVTARTTGAYEKGWVTDGWEDPTTIEGRPPRRYYELTENGKARMGALRAEARTEKRFAFIFTPGLTQ